MSAMRRSSAVALATVLLLGATAVVFQRAYVTFCDQMTHSIRLNFYARTPSKLPPTGGEFRPLPEPIDGSDACVTYARLGPRFVLVRPGEAGRPDYEHYRALLGSPPPEKHSNCLNAAKETVVYDNGILLGCTM